MKRGNVPTESWRGKSAVFRMYSALTSHGYSKSIKAVRRQRNLGLGQPHPESKMVIIAKNQKNRKLTKRLHLILDNEYQ
jgi:hypothetical protein